MDDKWLYLLRALMISQWLNSGAITPRPTIQEFTREKFNDAVDMMGLAGFDNEIIAWVQAQGDILIESWEQHK